MVPLPLNVSLTESAHVKLRNLTDDWNILHPANPVRPAFFIRTDKELDRKLLCVGFLDESESQENQIVFTHREMDIIVDVLSEELKIFDNRIIDFDGKAFIFLAREMP